MSKSNEIILDLIMLSKFGKNDGGRETWAYNFLPQLLLERSLKLNIFGYNDTSKLVHYDLINKFHTSHVNHVNVNILRSIDNHLPKAISMHRELKNTLNKMYHPQPTHVIAMGMFELFFLLSNKRYKKVKKIVWLRGIFLNEKAKRIPWGALWLFKLLERYLIKRVDIVLANGTDIQRFYETNYDLNVTVIENGIDIEKWSMPQPILGSIIKVAYIGRLSKVKGIEDYLKLIEKIKKTKYAPYFEFHVVGDANIYGEKISNLVEDNYIKYHGSIDNDSLPSFLSNIDVCVALTYSSKKLGGGGTSNALMEQMAASKVIMAWDNSIFRQLLSEKSAYLVEQYSVDGLQDSLIDIYNNKDEALIRAKKGALNISSYTMPKQVDKLLDLL